MLGSSRDCWVSRYIDDEDDDGGGDVDDNDDDDDVYNVGDNHNHNNA